MSQSIALAILGIFGGIVGVIGGMVGVVLGIVGFHRSKLDAIRQFYMQSDSNDIKNAKRTIFDSLKQSPDLSKVKDEASTVASFYEFWGKMVHMGYAPLSTFSGTTGFRAVRIYETLSSFISNQRDSADDESHSPDYAAEFEWLVTRISKKYPRSVSRHQRTSASIDY